MREKPITAITADMDAAAEKAEEEFAALADKHTDAIKIVGEWWMRWYMKAGHKRLGRILVRYAKALSTQS